MGVSMSDFKMLDFSAERRKAVYDWTRRYLNELMIRCEGNISMASRLVQIDRKYLRILLRRHEVDPGHYRQR
jgi:DNA-binding NtrC family response regulator